eukprot:3419737-Ditylum_brightwellii.AAC.1
MGISVTVDKEKVKEGWLGKAKGMKQVAHERGFIHVNNLKLYTKDGSEDDDGKIIDKLFSLKLIMGLFTDFVEEETLLQLMTWKAGELVGLNITVDRSPKGHPKIAGE